ncbi:methyltransferase domain-containing protein [Streptomyces sp. NPDC048636]|uniref:methyltransferase domain-containing protein n=1 Tax=Streptomyces sp. NPDC048636 TaxID=3155762 RepID=UPI003440B046
MGSTGGRTRGAPEPGPRAAADAPYAATDDPGATEAAARARNGLVRRLTEDGALTDPRWWAAFEAVPRHLFVPYYYEAGEGRVGSYAAQGSGSAGYARLCRDDPDPSRRARWLAGAYADAPLATRMRGGELISSSSQPSLMARMLEALEVADGNSVLEIGAGTGYNAALLAHRVGDERVTTLDLDAEITDAARAQLAAAGFRPAVVTGDGARGWPDRAPYDRIIATCAVPSVPGAWPGQCRPGGLILTPLATGLIALRVPDAGHAEGRFLATPAYFVPLRGTAPPPSVSTHGIPPRPLMDDSFRFLLNLVAGRMEPVEALALWEHEDRPGRERYGVTVRGDRQWAWLDDPEGPYGWPLGPGR